MSLFVYTNFASSTLASGIVAGDTQLTVQSGDGALYPAISAGQIAPGVLEDVDGNVEVVYFTARSSDTLTMVRAREGTTALDFASGSRVELRVTAGVLASLFQADGGDTITGTTTMSGIFNAGASGRWSGGEIVGAAIRGDAGDTSNQLLVPAGGGQPTIGGDVILTESNVASNLPSGTSLALTNMVVGWAGASNAIPSGWFLCDGSNSTPDLRDKFIVGGGGAMPTSGGSSTSSSNGSHDHGGVTGDHVLTIAEMPAHTHPGNISIPGSSRDNGDPGNLLITAPDEGNGTQTITITGVATQGGGGGHNHDIDSDGAHTHTLTPPYRAMFMIMKS